MKAILPLLIILLLFSSCGKDNVEEMDADPYALPWNTAFIHYENLDMCSSSHSSGYKLYYKDSLLMEECGEYGGPIIVDSVLVNNSKLHLFYSAPNSSYDLLTKDGGHSWTRIGTGPPSVYNVHPVTNDLLYCISRNMDYIYITGIENSDLDVYKDSLTPGTHYIEDYGTDVTNQDTAFINLDDSTDVVINFHP